MSPSELEMQTRMIDWEWHKHNVYPSKPPELLRLRHVAMVYGAIAKAEPFFLCF